MRQVDQDLLQASEDGDLEKAKRAIENGADVNVKNDVDRGLTPLHKACFNGKVAVISLLLEKGANVNAKSNDGWTPLHEASKRGHEAVVSLLLENGADIHAKNDNGQMPLHTACFYGHAAVVSILLEKGANINAKSNVGWTPLHEASYEGHGNIVSLLVGNGADVNAKDYYRDTPLHKASYNGHEAVVSLLLEKGADVNVKDKQGWTPLHWACVSGYDAAVSLLLEKGADPTITDEKGKTPLQIAQEYDKQNCVAAIEQFQPRFYRHLDEISTLVQHATENEFVSLVPTFEKAQNELSDFLQLKYYFTAVNAQYRLGTITTEDRNRLILAALEKAKVWCVSPFYVAMYRVALRYSLSENIITQFQLDQLDVASLECDIAHTDYIQAMQMIIRQNAMRISRLENSLAMFQQAVITSVCELQQNVIAINKNVQNMHRDMHGMAVAIIDTQAALKKFKASLEFKRKVEAGCSLVSAVLNAVSLGVAGSALQGALGLTLASIADFGDLAHLSGVLKQVATTIGDNVSIHDMLKLGIMLAKGYATQKLEDDALKNENAIVVITASAAIFTNALVELKVAGLEKKRERLIRQAKLAKELDKEFDSFYQQIQLIDEEIEELHDRINNIITASAAVFTNALELDATSYELVSKPSNEELPVFDKPSKDLPIAGEPSKGYNLNDAPSATALPASSSDNVEMEVAGLEKKCERLIRRAKLAKELDKEVDSIYQQIQLLDEEIEELHDRIDNIRI